MLKSALTLIRPDRLGDVVVSSSVLESLSERYGGQYEIIWSVKQEYAPLFSELKDITVVPTNKLGLELSRRPSGPVVFLNPDPELEKEFADHRQLYGWGRTLRDDRKQCKKAEAHYCAELLAAAGFPIEQPVSPTLGPLPPQEPFVLPKKPYVVIHVTAGGCKLTLTAPLIIETTEYFKRQGNAVVWIGLGDRVEERRKLKEAAVRMGAIDFKTDGGGVSDILLLASILKNARAVIGRDSGVTHLAAGLGAPTVAVIRPQDKRSAARRWSPMGPTARSIEIKLQPRWWESDQGYQKRYFKNIFFDDLIKPLNEVWHCQQSP